MRHLVTVGTGQRIASEVDGQYGRGQRAHPPGARQRPVVQSCHRLLSFATGSHDLRIIKPPHPPSFLREISHWNDLGNLGRMHLMPRF